MQLERSLSDHSVEAYLNDLDKLTQFLSGQDAGMAPSAITLLQLQQFTAWLHELGMSGSSQARIISGVRSFFT